jgi:predicted nucleic acid-binding protein
LDTSALVKRFVDEPGSAAVDRYILVRDPVATASIAYAELYSALTRKRREGDLSEEKYALACRQLEEEWQSYSSVELREDILHSARDLIQRHAIRAADGIHLASALQFQAGVGQAVTFVAVDNRLLRAAAAEHLQTVNVEKTPRP